VRAGDAPSTRALRGWQRRASVRYLTAKPRDFLLVATPGAGKTAFALRIAAIPFVRYEPDGNGVLRPAADRSVDTITVVVPTEHLKTQWAMAAAADGIALDPKFRNSAAHTSAEYHGIE
jgi:superfamily II DNA or RNA helicase